MHVVPREVRVPRRPDPTSEGGKPLGGSGGGGYADADAGTKTILHPEECFSLLIFSHDHCMCSPHSQMSRNLPASVFSEWRISFKDADPSQVLTDPDSGGQEVADDDDPGTSPDSAIRSFEVSSQTYFILPFSELW